MVQDSNYRNSRGAVIARGNHDRLEWVERRATSHFSPNGNLFANDRFIDLDLLYGAFLTGRRRAAAGPLLSIVATFQLDD